MMKRAVAAAAATAGLTVGALAMAAPAMATGTATYNCSPYYSSVNVSFDKDASGRLVLTTSGLSPKFNVTANGTVVTASLNGSTTNNPTKTLNIGSYSSITMTSPSAYGTISAAPSTITITATPPGTVINCTLISSGGGFPV